ncbi:hypothetical protein A2W13_02935 [Candidatus Woesebacteria bacterium RBG_16_36_11]|uniref:Ribulose-phosphate 3-epimerase n=3 Tax=Candidatus Woeseibacteriota TaxID=1752722 RepID=A0A1F7X9V5_9BACT|nr:MAG: hypothetical protein A2Z67_05390 [Candidatus Woesebacteria bacterium RBG_13_36_22]OGM11115.1 MAG: hypothetical protein A2W13_02935 [Candidatus Woesebacteria bacterium RBG_16_36_11]OGM16601.1 MAG: hypothetical protein A2V55_00565 [Candidatus Woesebacteria bacterium RBG_19FT_COMBO_37_29]
MLKPFEIIPSILTNNPEEVLAKIQMAEGMVGGVQIDVVDGIFAVNKTFDIDLLQDVDTDLKLDFHLMTKEPVNWVERCIRGGADRIIGQVEMMSDQLNFVQKVQEVGTLVGLALDLKSDISVIDDIIFQDLDVVLVLSVPAGFGGQQFEPKSLEKIAALSKIRELQKSTFKISVDGGITPDDIDDLVTRGADEAVIGERLFKGDLKMNLEKYRKVV